MSPEDIMKKVIFNGDIQYLISGHLNGIDLGNMNNPLREFVKCQIKECQNNGSTLQQEGFQVGEPWDGDILNAPVLFLSSNPAFNFYEASPRYKANLNQIVIPAYGAKGQQIFDLSSKQGKCDAVKFLMDFCKNRIQQAPLPNVNLNCTPIRNQTFRNKGFGIPLVNKKGIANVRYWWYVERRTEELLTPKARNTISVRMQNNGKNPNSPFDFSREIMKYVALMEIVPFRSNNSQGVTTASLNYCLQLTQDRLELSNAKIIVLVSKAVLDTFDINAMLSKRDIAALRNGSMINPVIGNKQRKIIWLGDYRGVIYNYITTGKNTTGHLTDGTLSALKQFLERVI